jgi:4-pyridoxolactonase
MNDMAALYFGMSMSCEMISASALRRGMVGHEQPKSVSIGRRSLLVDGFHMFWNIGSGGSYRFPVYSVLIEHEQGLLLFDTGFDGDFAAKNAQDCTPLQTERQSLTAQMALVNRRPSDVAIVMNSHYLFDHVGGNKLCTCANVVCHKHEMDAFLNPHPATEVPASTASLRPNWTW